MPGITRAQDTLICDNGGFEDGFKYYIGSSGYYTTGGDNCIPYYGNNQSNFTNLSMPSYRKFEIVEAGVDPWNGNEMVKFGTNSLLLNNRLGHDITLDECSTYDDANKVTKRFLVTNQNRSFTVWYSTTLESPPSHDNIQAFFSIKCNLAPIYNLCINTDNIIGTRVNTNGYCLHEHEKLVTTNWVCHRINIDKVYIGQIATIEIIASDCGCTGHAGYAYIDGICELCDGSNYGSGTLIDRPDIILSCDGDSITIKGRYTTPTILGYNILDNITVPGFNTHGMSINTNNNTFSFRILKSDFQFPNPDCRDVIAYLDFKNSSGDHLPLVPTNSIEICLDDFVTPDVNIIVGGCHRNTPHPDNNYSDDYYYVDFTIQDADNVHWTLERQLDDPPTGESGRSFLKQDGYGNGLHILGPFYIQEGPWTLILNYNHCSDTFNIIPPDYCSGCPALAKAKITNIKCNGTTWTYDLKVEGAPPGGTYKINSEGIHRFFNVQYYNIEGGAISQNCIDLFIHYWVNGIDNPCGAKFKICPPMPCFDNDPDPTEENYVPYCLAEAVPKDLVCINNGTIFMVNFITKGGGYQCYMATGNFPTMSGPFTNPLGPFTDDATITLFTCSTPFSCTCNNSNCYKVYFIDKPDDCPRDLEGRLSRGNWSESNELVIAPNPVIANEFLLRSKLKTTEFEIYNSTGMQIYSSKFEGDELRMKFNNEQGVYYLKYKDSSGLYKSVKFIKL